MRALPPTDTVTELCLVDGPRYDPRRRSAHVVLLRERDPARIAELADLLDVAAPWRPSAWMQEAETTLVLLEGRRVLAQVGLLEGGWLRTADADDLRLSNPSAVSAWLAATPSVGHHV